MSRGGARKRPSEPHRRCIATGESRPTGELLRFVVGPDGTLVPDLGHKLPGRGIWVSAARPALERAIDKRLFARAARQPVKVPDGLIESLEGALAERLVGLVALARKAGQAVAGYEKTRDWLVSGRAGALVQASDGSAREKARLRPPGNGRHVTCLTGSEIGLAFGRQTVIHAALAAGGLGDRVVEEAARLMQLRQEAAAGSPAGKDQRPDE